MDCGERNTRPACRSFSCSKNGQPGGMPWPWLRLCDDRVPGYILRPRGSGVSLLRFMGWVLRHAP